MQTDVPALTGILTELVRKNALVSFCGVDEAKAVSDLSMAVRKRATFSFTPRLLRT